MEPASTALVDGNCIDVVRGRHKRLLYFPVVLGSISEAGVDESGASLDENEAQRRHVVRRQRRHRGRGLSFMANDVVEKFNKVAISKLKVSSKEQVKE